MKPTLGLYIHIPFCVRRCPYCAFYSLEGAPSEQVEDYPSLVLAEFSRRSSEWRGFRLSSIFIGGGTPPILSPKAISRMLKAAAVQFDFLPETEITLEANPGTVTRQSLEGFRAAGIDRLSLGIQALNDDRLNFLGRIHTRAEALEALRLAKSSGFPYLSVDLMFGTPLETAATWNGEFEDLLGFEPDGISFYGLTVEEGTRFRRKADHGRKVVLAQDEMVDLMLHAADLLRKAGYRHYEVSNWALPGAECRHNQHYWQRGCYLGLGPSAHSFDGKKRSWNLPDLEGYSNALKAGKLPPSESEILSPEEVRSEWVYLRLRQDMGLDLLEYEEQFGAAPSYWKTMLESIAAKGLGNFGGGRFTPHDRGLLLADEIAARLLS